MKFIILLHKVAFDYVTLFDVYECAIDNATLERKLNEAERRLTEIDFVLLWANRQLGETTQRITTAQKASSPEFQAWLRHKNANGADIYVGMNALQQHASTRTKDDIEKISHVYLDLHHGGTASIEALENSDLVPRPTYVLNMSPEKFQIVWKVEGMTMRGLKP